MKAHVLLAVVFVARSAWAGNDESIPLGDQAALTGNAVAAMVDDGSSLVYNPAGLAAASRDQIDVTATGALLRVYRLPSLVTTSGGKSGDGNHTELVTVPSAVSYVRALGDDLRLGLGIFVPEASSSILDVSIDAPSQAFRLSIIRRDALYFAAAGLGFRASPRLNLGAALTVIYESQLGAAAAWAGTGEGEGRQLFGVSQVFSTTAIGVTASVGAQWEPTPGLHLGLAIRAPVILLLTAFDGSEVLASATAMPPAIEVDSTTFGELEWDVNQVRPLRARLGVAWAWDRSWVSLEAEVQPELDDDEAFESRDAVWNVRAGGMLAVGGASWVGAGVYTDRSAAPLPTESILGADLDFYGASVGLRLDHAHRLLATERAASVVFSTTLALRYAFGTGQYGGFEFAEQPAGGVPGQNRAVDARVHELGVHLGSTLYF